MFSENVGWLEHVKFPKADGAIVGAGDQDITIGDHTGDGVGVAFHLSYENGGADRVDLDPEVVAADNNIAFFAFPLLVEVEHQDFFAAVFVIITAGNARVGVVDELAQLGENS